MPEKNQGLSNLEQLKAENDFLKMKLMLENGAQFGRGAENDEELPAELENRFLKNLVEFEERWQEHKTIRIFDKIGRPAHFKQVNEIPDNEINQAWDELSVHLHQHGLSLDVCSPNITKRELYRFTTEELFEQETDDISMPGWVTGFIYDEFYPDHVYENSRAATDDCIRRFLDKQPLEWTHYFSPENLRLNEHYPLTVDELKKRVNAFKTAYDDLEILEIGIPNYVINEKSCRVDGTYLVTATIGKEKNKLSGNWEVYFSQDEVSGFWYINEVRMKGIRF